MRLFDRLGVIVLIAIAALSGAQSGGNGVSTTNATDSSPATSSASISSSSIAPAAASSASKPGNATCLSKTANYITHTLPQQCLRTDRLAGNATRTAGADEATAFDGIITELGSIAATTTTPIPPSETYGEGDGLEVLQTPTPSLIGSGSIEVGLPTPSDANVDSAPTLPGETAEADSPLDNANFLSFEEWKRQNQAKAEQAAEQPFVGDRQRPGINNALDSLGDEGEIELDFAGFGNGASVPRQPQAAYRTAEGAQSAASAAAESYTPRSKDAGKTCKERTNYASFDCAATVLKTNPECKSAPSVLVENKDSYMLNICSATNKFFIIELCNDILIDTVVLANYEFFSSIFRHFRLSVSDRYPVKMDRWKDLGTFEARNTREVQAFLIEQPQIWTRYLRIEFLSHYGAEYYCPVSLLRVHGTTMLEELRPDEDSAAVEDAEVEEAQEAEATAMAPLSDDELAKLDLSDKSAATTEVVMDVQSITSESQVSSAVETSSVDDSTALSVASPSSGKTSIEGITGVPSYQNDSLTCAFNSSSAEEQNHLQSSSGAAQLPDATADSPVPNLDNVQNTTASSRLDSSRKGGHSNSSDMDASSTVQQPSTVQNATSMADHRTEETRIPSSTMTANSSTITTDRKQTDPASQVAQSSTNSTRPTGTSSGSPPQPSTQESFFKSIQKRLAQLEANSTLSLQYIEEQSRILRDAFSKVEKRQISATTSFLSNLNDTVMAELRDFRVAYDQIWQSTVLELEGQREQYQRELLAISTRLGLVAEELVWQKRMGIVQSTLVLLCLGLVLFARGAGGTHYFEVPLRQQMMNRSSSALSKTTTLNDWDASPPASPSPPNRSPVSVFRRKLLWRSFTEPSSGAPPATGAGDSGTDSRPETRDGGPALDPFGKHMVDVKVQPPTPERNGSARMRGSASTFEDDNEEDGEIGEEIFEEVGEVSAPSSPEMVRSNPPPSELLRVGVGVDDA